MIKKIIEQEKGKIIAEICQKVVAKKWAEKLVNDTPMLVKALDIEQIKKDINTETNEEKLKKLKEDKECYEQYELDQKNVKMNDYAIEADVFALKVLSDSLNEITNLLK